MNLVPPHAWDLSPAEAVDVQRELAGIVLREGPPILVGRIAGVDVGFEEGGRITRAALSQPPLAHVGKVDALFAPQDIDELIALAEKLDERAA